MRHERSTVERPGELVWALVDAIIPLGFQGKSVLDAAIILGVNEHTAKRQISLWKKQKRQTKRRQLENR